MACLFVNTIVEYTVIIVIKNGSKFNVFPNIGIVNENCIIASGYAKLFIHKKSDYQTEPSLLGH